MGKNSKRIAELNAEEFYSRLRRLVRKYKPEAFALSLSRLLYSLIDDRNSWGAYPPHFVVSAIEANCAYYKTYISTIELTTARINEIVNHYKSYHDPYVDYALTQMEDLSLWTLAVARQQFPYQRKWDIRALARAILLFADNDPLPNSNRLFQECYGLGFQDWIVMCLAVVSMTTSSKNPISTVDQYLNTDMSGFPKEAVYPFFDASSLTFGEVGQQYLDIRRKYPSYLHIFLPSVFLNTPFIKYDQKIYLAVHPGLVFYHCLDGLHSACQRLGGDTFGHEFGRSFERYVFSLLKKITPAVQILNENDLKANDDDLVCDYAVILNNCLLLIECKAVKFSADLATENAIQNDNSSAKIAQALLQISRTAARIKTGSLRLSVEQVPSKMIGFVVTFGRINFANSPDYLDRFIMPRLANESVENISSPFDAIPQVVSVDALEDMITVINAESIDPCVLVEQKRESEYTRVGDWDPYLHNRYKNTGIDWASLGFEPVIGNFISQLVPDFPKDSIVE